MKHDIKLCTFQSSQKAFNGVQAVVNGREEHRIIKET